MSKSDLERIEENIQNNGFPLCRSELLQDIRKLARALDWLLEVIDKAGLDNLANGVQLGQLSWFAKASAAKEGAERTLREVAGEPEARE